MENRITSPEITSVADNEVFVFGSNTMGRHGRGAAKVAMKFGAKYGVGEGLSGRTYGLPTKGSDLRYALKIEQIKRYADAFVECAKANPERTFLVTEIGCGLAGYKPKEVAPLFAACIDLENVHLPASFWRVLSHN